MCIPYACLQFRTSFPTSRATTPTVSPHLWWRATGSWPSRPCLTQDAGSAATPGDVAVLPAEVGCWTLTSGGAATNKCTRFSVGMGQVLSVWETTSLSFSFTLTNGWTVSLGTVPLRGAVEWSAALGLMRDPSGVSAVALPSEWLHSIRPLGRPSTAGRQ